LESDETEEVHTYHRIAARPNVHQHDRECLTEKHLIRKDSEECHYGAPEEEHEKEVGCPPTKGILFKHPTIAIREDHIEQKIESYGPEKHEVRD